MASIIESKIGSAILKEGEAIAVKIEPELMADLKTLLADLQKGIMADLEALLSKFLGQPISSVSAPVAAPAKVAPAPVAAAISSIHQ